VNHCPVVERIADNLRHALYNLLETVTGLTESGGALGNEFAGLSDTGSGR
jgi:hypothetical protein